MMHIIAEVSPGACGLASRIVASSPDGARIVLEIESDCPKVQAYAAQVTELDAFEELLSVPVGQTSPVLLAAEHKLHTTCLLPLAVLKAAEAAAGLALPQNACVELERVE
jgi:hypothetical protein